jgi:hypothetical protein
LSIQIRFGAFPPPTTNIKELDATKGEPTVKQLLVIQVRQRYLCVHRGDNTQSFEWLK